ASSIREAVTLSELTTLFNFSRKTTFGEWIGEALDIFRRGFQYPDIAVVEYNLGGELFRTPSYKKTGWSMCLPVHAQLLPVDDSSIKQLVSHSSRPIKIGTITVCYLQERPREQKGPFTAEEVRLFRVAQWCMSNITERKWRDERMNAYAERIRSMTTSLAVVEQRERRRFAEIVHDKLGQNLTLLNFQLGRVVQASASPKARSGLKEAQATLKSLISESRDLTFELCPPMLYDVGLEAAIRWLAGRFKSSYGIMPGISMRIGAIESEVIKVTLYHAVNELLMNVAKHAHASAVEIRACEGEGTIVLSISDNGTGFKTPHAGGQGDGERQSFGLFNLSSKISHLNGRLDIKSSRRGSRVTITLPVRTPHAPGG
ncbi:MAG: ATP-binding protein, partial [Myxococcota bacterium]